MNIGLESIGWSAEIFFVVAYFLVSTRRLSGDGVIFNGMNLVGALLYGTYAIIKHLPPVIILELFWGGIAAIALGKIYWKYRQTKTN